jgi:uncharacterized protein with GYD domain
MRRSVMPKYLIQGNYTAEGAKGLLKDGGSKRVRAAKAAMKAIGAKVEAMYFAFGGTDVFVIVDAPDNASMTALSLTVAGTGALSLKTTVLLTPEEVDEASKKAVSYSPPGR